MKQKAQPTISGVYDPPDGSQHFVFTPNLDHPEKIVELDAWLVEWDADTRTSTWQTATGETFSLTQTDA